MLTEIGRRRIAVVRAGPGSGKTYVFSEAARRGIRDWSSRVGGVAALSFTNVAKDEIADRLGGLPSAPHFLGTLDSFFWRFVVAPFSHLEGTSAKGAILIPAPLDKALEKPTAKYGPDKENWEPLFSLAVQGGDEGTPGLVRRDWRLGKSVVLTEPYRTQVLKEKQAEWARTGRMTHSDCQYLAARILKGKHGSFVAGLLARRFPLILIDEFQDTGWFLGRAVLALLSHGSIRATLVGDPDQAIYQFGGAYKELFDDAEKVAQEEALPLHETHRCSSRISAVASGLSRSRKQVVPLPQAPEGEAILVVHHQKKQEISIGPVLDAVRSALDRLSCTTVAVLARKGDTVLRLRRPAHVNDCPWRGGVGGRLNTAAERCLSGEVGVARRLVDQELAELVLAGEKPTHIVLQEKGLAMSSWRRCVGELLLENAKAVPEETWNGWIERMKGAFRGRALRLGWQEDKRRLGDRFKRKGDDGDRPRLDSTPSPQSADISGIEILTVHQAKGRTFDGVVVYVPKTQGKNAKCPSDEWWSSDAESEEMEVAFVACSRARRLLAIAVHEDVYQGLCQKRPDFVAQFAIETLPRPPAPPRNKRPISASDPRDVAKDVAEGGQ